MGDFAKRLATAAVLVPATVAAIFLDPTHWSVTALAGAVAAFSLDEYLRMALPAGPDAPRTKQRVTTGALGLGLIVLSSAYSLPQVLTPFLIVAVLGLGIVALVDSRHEPQAGRFFAVGLSGLLYVPFLVSVLPLLKRADAGEWLTVTLCMAFFSDTGAYLAGRKFGRHKLYPAVSPAKTWEGSVGGVLGSCLASVGVGSLWLLPSLPIPHAFVLGVLGSISGQAGDLFESLLKRTFGVKDSGRILPGHGGMLDRVDALIFVAPVTYTYVMFFQA